MLRRVTLTRELTKAWMAGPPRRHRHHDPSVGEKFCVGAWDDSRGVLCGVAQAGRPVAKSSDHRRILEVTRVCTDGTRNACSFLYASCRDVARGLGYFAVLTYTLDSESGASLRALGWWGEPEATPGRPWGCPSRPRSGGGLGAKTRWVYFLQDWPPVVEPEARASSQLSLLEVA